MIICLIIPRIESTTQIYYLDETKIPRISFLTISHRYIPFSENCDVDTKNIDYIEQHNQKQDPVPSYTLGHNHFSDIPNSEFRKIHSLGQHAPDFKPLLEARSAKMQKLQQSSLLRGGQNGSDEESDLTKLPTHEVNWVEGGAVTPVKNQERW